MVGMPPCMARGTAFAARIHRKPRPKRPAMGRRMGSGTGTGTQVQMLDLTPLTGITDRCSRNLSVSELSPLERKFSCNPPWPQVCDDEAADLSKPVRNALAICGRKTDTREAASGQPRYNADTALTVAAVRHWKQVGGWIRPRHGCGTARIRSGYARGRMPSKPNP